MMSGDELYGDEITSLSEYEAQPWEPTGDPYAGEYDEPERDEAPVTAWCVGYDHLDGKLTWVVGPSDAKAEQVAALLAGEGRQFRMYDDDGELYYSGRTLGDDDFAPLDDYGAPGSGCTSISYRDDSGRWVTL